MTHLTSLPILAVWILMTPLFLPVPMLVGATPREAGKVWWQIAKNIWNGTDTLEEK